MAYSEQVLHRARARLEQAKAEREQENAAHRADAYARYPRLAEIDNELRRTMAELMAAALQRGEDPSQAVAAVREKNLALQRERSWILEAGDFDDGYLDDTPVCAKCGGRGYVGAQMCSCLRELCRQEQKKELTSLLGSGRETFENFRLDLYPAEYSESVRTSPRALMQRNFNHCRKYAQNFTMQSGNMLFSGATGLGKTFLSACIARTVADRGYSVVYDTAIHLFSDFEAEKFGMSQEENRGLSQRYLQCDLLIIDDLGTENDDAVRLLRPVPCGKHPPDGIAPDDHLHESDAGAAVRALFPADRLAPARHLSPDPVRRAGYPAALTF